MTKQSAIDKIKCFPNWNLDDEWLLEDEMQELSDMAVAALEKQIPKEPIEYEDKYYGCPVCGNPVMHKWEKYPTILNDKKNGLPYCLGCGQALDWRENSKD